MKNGKYKVSFYVDLVDCVDQEEAELEVGEMISEAIDNEMFPNIEFELVEEQDLEYEYEEEDVPELNFELEAF